MIRPSKKVVSRPNPSGKLSMHGLLSAQLLLLHILIKVTITSLMTCGDDLRDWNKRFSNFDVKTKDVAGQKACGRGRETTFFALDITYGWL